MKYDPCWKYKKRDTDCCFLVAFAISKLKSRKKQQFAFCLEQRRKHLNGRFINVLCWTTATRKVVVLIYGGGVLFCRSTEEVNVIILVERKSSAD